MSLAPWRSPLARALHRNRSRVYSRYLQLATVRPEGSPANRTVVFRGFLPESDRLMIVTDARSDKCLDIAHNPAAEICWYFTQTREQFRLRGSLALITPGEPDSALQEARRQTWQALSDNARQQFTWPHPGDPRETADLETVLPDSTVPLSTFCLLLLDPVGVDHLELRGEPQNRYQYTRQPTGNWEVKAVNP